MNPITMKLVVDDLILQALREDITFEDVSTASVCPTARPATVELIAKADGIIAGLDVFARTFELLDPQSSVLFDVADGDEVHAGDHVGQVRGDARVLLPYAEPARAAEVDQMRWSALWLTHRADWGRLIDAYPVGHALPEMLLAPFIGLTGKAWLLPVQTDFFSWPLAQRLVYLDQLAADRLHQLDRPSRLAPLPILGIPGWHAGAQDADFYANTAYFCPSRRAPSVWAA